MAHLCSSSVRLRVTVRSSSQSFLISLIGAVCAGYSLPRVCPHVDSGRPPQRLSLGNEEGVQREGVDKDAKSKNKHQKNVMGKRGMEIVDKENSFSSNSNTPRVQPSPRPSGVPALSLHKLPAPSPLAPSAAYHATESDLDSSFMDTARSDTAVRRLSNACAAASKPFLDVSHNTSANDVDLFGASPACKIGGPQVLSIKVYSPIQRRDSFDIKGDESEPNKVRPGGN